MYSKQESAGQSKITCGGKGGGMRGTVGWMRPPCPPHGTHGTPPLQAPSAHHAPEEGEGSHQDQEQDQHHVLGPLVEPLALLLCNLGRGRKNPTGWAPLPKVAAPQVPAPFWLTCSAVRHGRARGCWKSFTPAQMGMRT